MSPAFRASEVARVLHCPGSTRLIPRIAKPDDSAESLEGTWCHHRAHALAKSEHGAIGEIGPEPVAPPNVAFCQWIPQYYVDTLAEQIPQDWSWQVEVDLSADFDRFSLTGHPDDLAINPDATEARGADLKAGHSAVDEAESNLQFLVYIVLTKLAYPSLTKISWLGCQPRNDDDTAKRVTVTTLEGVELDNAVAYIEREINRAMDNSWELNTGIRACQWCPAAVQCPAVIAKRELMKVTLTPEALEHIKATPNDALLGDWALAATLLTKPLKTAVDLAKERIEKAGYIDAASGPRLLIKVQNGDISYPKPTKFREALELVLPEREAQDRCTSWTKGDIIKEIAKARDIPQESKDKVDAKSVWEAHLKPLTEQGTRRLLVIQG